MSRTKTGLRSAMGVGLALLLATAGAIPAAADPNATSEPSRPSIPDGPPVLVSPTDSASALPPIDAVGWMVADATTGQIMASRGADVPNPPASTLKVLTAYSLFPHLQPKSTYIATTADEGADGSHAGIVAGGKYRVLDIAHGMLLPSGNDCASALAHAYGGWRLAVAKMNSEARRIGALHTHAKNPSGLDADGQVTTPKDLVTLFRAALGVPLFRETIGTRQVKFPGGPGPHGKQAPSYTIESQDHLLHHGYPGLIGGKSGYTTNAGRTFVGAAERNGHTLIYSLMQTQSSTEDVARALLDWGFANIGKVNAVGALPMATAPAEPAIPLKAAQYSIDGKLLSTPGQTAGAASVAKVSNTKPAPATNIVATNTSSVVSLPWLPAALLAFVSLLLLLVVIRAITTFRKNS